MNMSDQLAQRLYSKFADTGQIIPDKSKEFKKLRPKKNLQNVKLPELAKTPAVEKPPYPTLHFPKGFERFSGLDKLHLTQTIKPDELSHRKLPSLSKVSSHQSFTLNKPEPSFSRTLAPSPHAGASLLKHPLQLSKISKKDQKLESIEKYGLGDGIKSLSLLKKEQDLALRKLEDAPRRSVTQLAPLEVTPKKAEIEDEDNPPPIVFNREFGGSLSSKDLNKKNIMDDKDYLTPLDFIAC